MIVRMKNFLKDNWSAPGGFKSILIVAIPLILSTGANGLQMFVDRTFLMWYGGDSISACMQGGITWFTILSLFQGTIGYVNTFVAQYTGAKKDHKVGSAVWQGIYLSCAAGSLMLLLRTISQTIFSWFGHDAQIQLLEVQYFDILCFNSLPALLGVAISTFFTGRGKANTVLVITLFATLTNTILDYVMIFGKLGLPAMGIKGAGWATVIATIASTSAYAICLFRPSFAKAYNTVKGALPDVDLLKRVIKYGFPNGLDFMLQMTSWTIFVSLSGRISNVAMNATAVVGQIESLSYMPMIGIAIAVSTLVGQSIGQNRLDAAVRTTYCSFVMTFLYMGTLGICYFMIPDFLMLPFSTKANPAEFEMIRPVIRNLLIIIGIKCMFGPGIMTFSSCIKGAGDTKFVMIVTVALMWTFLTIPALIVIRMGGNVYMLWSLAAFYAGAAHMVFLARFLNGKWKTMKVIETETPAPTPETNIFQNEYVSHTKEML